MQKLNTKQMIIAVSLFAFAAMLFVTPRDEYATFWYSIAVGGLMVTFWLFEVVPIYITALFPLILGVPLGILNPDDLTSSYGHKYVYLFLGGFMLSLALEKWEVHKQIAERILRIVGTSKSRIILGFLLSTGLLSMWISNTATALMMLPMATAILANVAEGKKSKFSIYLLLSVAYGASIGGMATLVGSPPNIAMAGILEKNFGIEVSFLTWMQYGLPLSLIMLLIVFSVFYILLGKGRNEKIHEIEHEHKKWSTEQIRVMLLFSFIVLLWSFRIPLTKYAGFSYTDEGVAIFGSILLFFLPGAKKSSKLLEWKDTRKLPWGILILFGGGMALANMLRINGVIDELAKVFNNYTEMPLVVILGVIVAIAIFGTELMSNLALVSVFVPVIAAFALKTDYTILQLCMPVTLAASCAFMLPVGTPPNAIVFSSGQLRISQMAKTGFVLNSIGVLIIVLFSLLFITG